MHKFAVIAFAAMLPLAGCVTANNPAIAEAQDAAVAACSFLPTIATVTAILNTGKYATALQVAAAICAAVTPKAGGTRFASVSATPHVAGIAVKGRFIKR